jgi:pyrroloquinoline quinone biosynthesis protein B
VKAIILGLAAGSGVPQWNCRCLVCGLAWDGDATVRPRTQSSLALSADEKRWFIVNARRREPLTDPLKNLKSIEVRHNNIREDKVERFAVLFARRRLQLCRSRVARNAG